ncbi:MAG: C_GCAxxG_C_C family protein [Ruminococcus sp.]|uniref:C-GCAxxG-C-C family protein n=1 Tax=Ruminococcus sp. TaxID=41978 RepID=UPI002873BC10|nr:C-GCAxxG-C-C family protein [Ruminococcus sp.]MBQ3284799.1 C_GCAxxG_C_C family protein [Ruminococcus sp.]
MIDHGKIAEENFRKGYNCAQSVLLAFGDMTGLDERTAAMLSSSFGGGLGRLREVCGAVSGAAMVLGLVKGYSDPDDREAKKAHYRRVQEFAGKFREQNGSIICRELLAGVPTAEGRDPEARTDAYYQKRPCAELCRCAARILDDMLTTSE